MAPETLDVLIAHADGETPLAFPQLLEMIYASRLTGTIDLRLHCRGGVPHEIEVGRPVKFPVADARRARKI